MKTFIASAVAYIVSAISCLWCYITYVKDPSNAWYSAFCLVFGLAVTYCVTELCFRVFK